MLYMSIHTIHQRKCVPAANPVTNPRISIDSNNIYSDSIKLTLTHPTFLGEPEFFHYKLRLKINNNGAFTYLNLSDPVTKFQLISRNEDSSFQTYHHKSLLPGVTYNYILEAVSLDNEIWSLLPGSQKDPSTNSYLGISDQPQEISVTTKYLLQLFQNQFQKVCFQYKIEFLIDDIFDLNSFVIIQKGGLN